VLSYLLSHLLQQHFIFLEGHKKLVLERVRQKAQDEEVTPLAFYVRQLCSIIYLEIATFYEDDLLPILLRSLKTCRVGSILLPFVWQQLSQFRFVNF
jgi:hypothetical protein